LARYVQSVTSSEARGMCACVQGFVEQAKPNKDLTLLKRLKTCGSPLQPKSKFSYY